MTSLLLPLLQPKACLHIGYFAREPGACDFNLRNWVSCAIRHFTFQRLGKKLQMVILESEAIVRIVLFQLVMDWNSY